MCNASIRLTTIHVSMLFLCLNTQTCDSYQPFPLQYSSRLRSTSIKGQGDNVDWWKREDVEVIQKVVEDPKSAFSLFDDAYNMKNLDGKANKYSVSEMTLREISEAYQFSLSYLGDFVVQLGVVPPIDVDTKLSNILMAEQTYSLLEAITSLDPFDSNVEYDTISISELADELDIPTLRIMRICRGEGFNLPFGMETILHEAVVERIREVYDFEDYIDDRVDSRGDVDEYGDAIGSGSYNFESNTSS